MRFSTALVASALAAFAAAQNAFTMISPPTIPAGTTYNITWTPTTQGTVSLILVQATTAGGSIVNPVSTIAANITNSGSYAWMIPSTTPKGSGYALEIVSDSNANIINYSKQFAIDSNTIAATTTALSASTTVTTTVTSSGTDSSSATGPTSSGFSSSATGSTTKSMTTITSTSASATAAATTAATTSKNAAETARAGIGMLAFVGAAMLVL